MSAGAARAPMPRTLDDGEMDPLEDSGKYVTVQTLGRGTFGFVVLSRVKETKELVAVKLLPRGELNKYVEAEIVNHSLLRHPHVVQFKEVFLTSKYICIAMEYAMGGSLFHYVTRHGLLKEAVARWFFQQLVIGVDYCHKRGVANRDIKLENTLLQVMPSLPLPLVKICDFGYSKADFKSAAKSKVGTLTYMAPEVLISHSRGGEYDGKVADIWSMGVVLYTMLVGAYPFDAPTGGLTNPKDVYLMLVRMLARKFSVPPELDISPACIELLQRLLHPDPRMRISIPELMEHPWFQTNLPPEAMRMNSKVLSQPSAGQPLEVIQRTLQAAAHAGLRHLGGSSSGGSERRGDDTDMMLSQAIDSAINETMLTSSASVSLTSV